MATKWRPSQNKSTTRFSKRRAEGVIYDIAVLEEENKVFSRQLDKIRGDLLTMDGADEGMQAIFNRKRTKAFENYQGSLGQKGLSAWDLYNEYSDRIHEFELKDGYYVAYKEGDMYATVIDAETKNVLDETIMQYEDILGAYSKILDIAEYADPSVAHNMTPRQQFKLAEYIGDWLVGKK